MAEDILAAIDGALGDYAVSGDAMRWVPPENRRPVQFAHPPARRYPAPVRRELTPEQAAEMVRQLGGAIRVAFERWSEVCQVVGESMSFGEALRESGLLPETPPEEDLRARALWLARHRSSGPDRDVVHQRRSRRVP